MELDLSARTRLVFVDHYREVAEGRPKELARTYEELTSEETHRVSVGGETEEQDREEASELEGATVVFSWSEEAGGFEPRFEGDGGDAELLEDLVEDCDLRAFLPGREVAEDEGWSVEAAAFDALFNPGGDVGLESEEDDQDSEERNDQLREHLSGEIRATFKGLREEGEERVAVIALACDVATYSEIETTEEGVTSRERFEMSFDLEGEILWRVAGGHPRSFAVEGPVAMTMKQETEGEYEGESFSFSQTLALGGTARSAGTWEGE
jgi:hypothetical protein